MAPIVRLMPDRPCLAADVRILKARDFLAFKEADQILAEARRHAQEILSQAEQVREEHRMQGYREGLDKSKGEAAGHMLETIGQMVDYLAGVEGQVVEIVLSAVRKILGEFDDTERLVRIVRNALEILCHQSQVTVRVCPAQAGPVRARINDMLAGYSGIGTLEVVPDARLSQTGCILETEIGVVDASLEVQMQILEKALRSRLSVPREFP